MSLYRRGPVWWIELYTDQGRHRESSGTADKKAAQEFHEKRKSELWRRDKLGEVRVTWGEAVAKWLSLKPRGMPDRYRIRSFGVDVHSPLPLSLQTIQAVLEGSQPATFNRGLALIVAIHNAAGIKPPPVKRLPNPPGRTRFLQAEEWARLLPVLEAESPLLAQCARFAIATGLRENNVLNLTWDQIDSRNRHAWLHADQTKQGAPLGVRLTDAAMGALSERRGIHKVYVFAHPESGLPLVKASNRAWYAALRKAKLVGLRWHDLRHTWASWHVMNGTRIEELQGLGGWKTLTMVQRYAHLASKHLAGVAENARPVSLRYNARKRG